MSFNLVCENCGAPSGASVGVCPFCKSVMHARKPGAGAQASAAETAIEAVAALVESGHLPDALAEASVASQNPAIAADPAFQSLYARILLKTEGPTTMIKGLVTKALLADPANQDAADCLAIAIAKTHLTHGRNDPGELELREVLKRSPKDVDALFFLGAHLFWEEGDVRESRVLLERCVAGAPNLLRAWGCLGEIYGKLGDPAMAARAFRKCAEIETEPQMKKFFESRATQR